MKSAPKKILTINGGSSSIKFALFEVGAVLRRIWSGQIERIGLPGARLTVKDLARGKRISQKISAPSHLAAVGVLTAWMGDKIGPGELAAIGHRVVHGGPQYSQPERITAKVVRTLRQLTPFDPEHLPEEIVLTEAFLRRFPKLPQIACFDTAFHHAMPRVARLLPIPFRYFDKGVRRYGFHGLSYEFLLGELRRVAGARAARGRLILAHLGNGASLAAVKNSRPVDTSMSLTPTAGLPMSSRSGDLDPGLAWFLARTEKMTPRQFNELVNFQSGLLGLSGTSSDMRDLLRRAARDSRAADAVAVFCYQAKKFIGAYAAALAGLDTLVFSGGIGEHSPAVRARICAGLSFLGLKLDSRKNAANAALISAPASRVAVRVIPTDEEWIIAKTVARILSLHRR
ncbi:MAG: acetate/propionate family kinase [Opitutales bacterium]